uniref:Uncharacterized protein n=1 Tax=Pseudo-nitzschia australis TaxID=44445 RepID=A0A7S4ASM6_9STRA
MRILLLLPFAIERNEATPIRRRRRHNDFAFTHRWFDTGWTNPTSLPLSSSSLPWFVVLRCVMLLRCVVFYLVREQGRSRAIRVFHTCGRKEMSCRVTSP